MHVCYVRYNSSNNVGSDDKQSTTRSEVYYFCTSLFMALRQISAILNALIKIETYN